jgi:N4-(beta-N-acetylglucosaminyl)-L-asparaginase
MKRRNLIKLGIVAGVAAPVISACKETKSSRSSSSSPVRPIVVSTWKAGIPANNDAWAILGNNGYALDAVEKGVMNAESDPANSSVGYGGLPDRNGDVTLDACIMNEQGDCGAVACIKNIKHPIAVARKVMEDTPHVMLVGEGAKSFALSAGHKEEDLTTEKSRQAYKEWLKTSEYKPIINIENHDTIGMLAIDSDGRICGACTTSGLAYKLPGRVGDSPIIGAGLYIDQEVGGAVATGLGEEIVKASACSITVELMRQGMSPEEACKEVITRIMKKVKDVKNTQVSILALNKDGEYGSYSIYAGFDFALHDGDSRSIPGSYFKEWSD